MSTIRVFYAIYAIFNLFDFSIRTRSSESHRPFSGPRSFPIRSLAWLTGSLTISCFCIFLSGCGVLSQKGSLETKVTSEATAQTTTTCGQTSQSGTDGGNALWQLGTPCATGTNSGGYMVSSISYWVGTPASASFDLGVYSSSSGAPGSLLCSVSTGTITPSSGWNSVNISGCPALSASTTYWVGYITGSNQIEQGTVSGSCPGTSYHSHWSNSTLSGVSLGNPFPANTLDSHSNCYSLYMTLAMVSGSTGSGSTGSLSITTASLPSGQVGTAYSTTLAATGGTTPYTWSLTSGTLPAGLSLNASTGAITGTPTASANATALTFQVTDSSSPVQTKSATVSLTVNSSVTTTTTTCGQTSQTGVDSGDALWQLGTPCATGTNSGGYTVSSISYWVGTPTSTSFNLGVYSNSSGTPSSLLCSVSTGTITPSSGWNSVNISSCPALSASTTYWVGYITGSNQIEQGTVSGSCPGTSYHSNWSNSTLSGVSLVNPFPANTPDPKCYSLYMTLNPASGSSQSGGASGPILTINAQSVSFGNVAVNGSATQSIVFTSSGSTPVIINALTLSGSGFTISGMSFPVTLNPGQAATLNVEFIPAIVGPTTGQLTVTSDSSTNPTLYVALSGTGQTQAQAYQVVLNWDAAASSSDPVAGYNIYRSAGSSSFQRLNSSVNIPTSYEDASVQASVTYSYYVTTVDGSGAESAPSGTVTVSVP